MTTDQFPACPFCQAPWTEAMLAEFAHYSSIGACPCCGGGDAAANRQGLPVPEQDLCCASCGRAIYRKP